MGRATGELATDRNSNLKTAATAKTVESKDAGRLYNNGGHISSKWEEIIYVQVDDLIKIREEAEQYKTLLDEGVWEALEKGNMNFLRYAKNRLERIKKCVDAEIRERVAQGDKKAVKQAMRKLMLTPWEGPIVKFTDQKLQYRLEKGEERHKNFILNCQKWVDENVLIMVQKGDDEGLRMATNQAHYKSLRNMRGQRSYLEVASNNNSEYKLRKNVAEEEWQVVQRRKRTKKVPSHSSFTIFISGIPMKASAREVWNFFSRHGKILDIILPRKRDKNNRRIGFVKVPDSNTMETLLNKLQFETFYSQPLHMNVAKNTNNIPQIAGMKPRVNIARDTPQRMSSHPDGLDNTKLENDSQPQKVDLTSEEPSKKAREEVKISTLPIKKILQLEISKDIESIVDKSMVCFSEYPLNGDILQEILVSLGYDQILVKEVSCFKFILSFRSKKQRNEFDFTSLKDWIVHPRPMEQEDYKINRKALIEIRGLPCNAWNENNLKNITKDIGSWGWWENNPMHCNGLENPRIWTYVDSMEKISSRIQVKIGEPTFDILLYELESWIQKGKDDSASKIQEGENKTQSPEGLKEHNLAHKDQVVQPDNGPPEDLINNMEDKNLDPVDPSISTGDLQMIEESSQSSICNMIRKINICRRRKSNKRKSRNNPFDIGRCKFSKINKKSHSKLPQPRENCKSNQVDLDKEAMEILQMAEDMGLQLKKSRSQAIKDIKDQLLRSLV
ncbi:hypothetical protein ACET3Z_022226 [Daucus carota]